MSPITIAINHFGFIAIQGKNSASFLQGQLTCDIHKINKEKSSFGSCCNHKGRMIANFFVFQNDQEHYFLLPKSMIPLTILHLKKYAVFSNVKLTFVDNVIDFNIPEIILEELDKNSWRTINVNTGLVWLYPETSGKLIPQMINLQKWGGVSFTKGCFIGQEIIARTEHLGKLKRHLYRAVLNDTNLLLKPGDELRNKNDQPVGIVVEIARKNTKQEILAVIQDTALKNEEIAFNHTLLKNLDLIPILPDFAEK